MKIRDVFKKDIDRKISAVVTLDTEADDILRQEIEEYVVTDEIENRLETFFEVWTQAEKTPTDETGVWISGFFGSGKSHFLKMIGYLLQNKLVDGKRAIDYFLEEDKLSSPKLIDEIKQADQIPTDVILFDVDTKSDTNAHNDKDALVKVFYRVFLDMQGYYGSIPSVARLERRLTQANKYLEFQTKFEEISGQKWIESRNEFDFLEDDVVATLIAINMMTEQAARNWVLTAQKPFAITPDEFADEVQSYIEDTGHRVAFLADEIGQYIGDDSALMLNLQSITKTLGTHSMGKAWMIVTSQQEFDENIIDQGTSAVSGRDFSKIQARFNTRLSLASSNVDEVIKKRLFDKNDAAKKNLTSIYETNEMTLKNLLQFKGGSEKKLFESVDDFVSDYPAVPYQVPLLGKVLNSIREHSASGRSMSEGERSMLGFFQAATQEIESKSTDHFISFDQFYASVQANLDDSHQRMIVQAGENSLIQENLDINLRVLKVLLLIKYLPNDIRPTVDNLTSLLVGSVSEDRLSLQKAVAQALIVLEQQNFIRKEIDQYFFLTNEEQEVNLEIQHKTVDEAAIAKRTQEIVFEDILSDQLRVNTQARQAPFVFGYLLDDATVSSNSTADLSVRLLTPMSSTAQAGDDAIGLATINKSEVVIHIKQDNYQTEIVQASKIEQWIRQNNSQAIEGFGRIKEEKQKELIKHKAEATRLLVEALNQADVFVQDSKLDNEGEIAKRVSEAERLLIERVYTKLEYINSVKHTEDIEDLLSGTNTDLDTGENVQALSDLRDFISRRTQVNSYVNLRSVLDVYEKAPYGYDVTDIEWLVTTLYIQRDIELFKNSVEVDDNNTSVGERIKLLTNNREVDRVQLKVHVKTDERLIRKTKEIGKSLHWSIDETDEFKVMKGFQAKFEGNLQKELAEFQVKTNQSIAYPGVDILDRLSEELSRLDGMTTTVEFYNFIKNHADEILENIDDYDKVHEFFVGEQHEIWEHASDIAHLYEESHNYIQSEDVDKIANEIREILQRKKFHEISQLPALRQQFNDSYTVIAEEHKQTALSKIDHLGRYIDEYTETHQADSVKLDFTDEIDRLKSRINNSNSLKEYAQVDTDINQIRNNLTDAVDRYNRQQAQLAASKQKMTSGDKQNPTPIPVVRRVKKVSLTSTYWSISNEDELDRKIRELHRKLSSELSDSDEINITF